MTQFHARCVDGTLLLKATINASITYVALPALYPMVPSPTPYDLPFSHNTADWHTIVPYDFSRSCNINDFHARQLALRVLAVVIPSWCSSVCHNSVPIGAQVR